MDSYALGRIQRSHLKNYNLGFNYFHFGYLVFPTQTTLWWNGAFKKSLIICCCL